VGFLDDAFDVVHGGASTITDTAGFLGDVLTGDVHGAATNGRQVLGDLDDVLHGLEGLGANLGQVPRRFAESTLVKLTDSPPIDAALLAIDALKATTGSGTPEDGSNYGSSADLLEEALDLLIDARPLDDRWNGDASTTYGEKAHDHKNLTSRVQVADRAIQQVLRTEADQVSRARSTLDDTSQYLHDFALATSWMNLVPGGRAAKLALDAAAAGTGLTTATFVVANLTQESFTNAGKIRDQLHHYNDAAAEKLNIASGACDPFVDARTDVQPGHRPERLDPEKRYEVPSPLEPIPFGPPATPYRVTGSSPSGPTPPSRSTPQAPAFGAAPMQRSAGLDRPSAGGAPVSRPSAQPYQDTTPSGARASGTSRPRAPLGTEQHKQGDQVTTNGG
jgi:hypothetical protein